MLLRACVNGARLPTEHPRLSTDPAVLAAEVTDVAARKTAIKSWAVLPDFASLNWHEDGADEIAAGLAGRGIGIEAGIWNDEGRVAWRSSPYRGQCHRALVEVPDLADASEVEATGQRLVDGIRETEPTLSVLLHGEGASTWPTFDLAVMWGLDTRIGLEDTLHLPDGRVATGNEDLVATAVGRTHERSST
ncbi:MAG: 3-keto-5-aminohexanoate cleavage protein [Galactobacter sp.]